MVISNFLLLPSVFVVFSRLDSFSPSHTKESLYSKGKATRNRALAVYKSGALRSVNSGLASLGFDAKRMLASGGGKLERACSPSLSFSGISRRVLGLWGPASVMSLSLKGR